MSRNILSACPVFHVPGEESAGYSPDQRVGLAHAANHLQAHRKHGAELTGAMECAVRVARNAAVPRADFLDLCEAILGPGVILTARRCWLEAEQA
jgi:hypothetical protein